MPFDVKTDKEMPGLKALRKVTDKKPTHHCDNCKRDRYSPCTCIKKNK